MATEETDCPEDSQELSPEHAGFEESISNILAGAQRLYPLVRDGGAAAAIARDVWFDTLDRLERRAEILSAVRAEDRHASVVKALIEVLPGDREWRSHPPGKEYGPLGDAGGEGKEGGPPG